MIVDLRYESLMNRSIVTVELLYDEVIRKEKE